MPSTDQEPTAGAADRRSAHEVLPGVEELTTRVYLAILRQRHATRALLVAQGMPGAAVDEALELLSRRGLVIRGKDGACRAISPDVALPAYATDLERQARSVRASAHELAQVYHQTHARPAAGDDQLQLLRNVDDMHRATADIVAAATTRVRALRDLSARTKRLFAAPLESQREKSYAADGRPLVFETAYVIDVLDLPRTSEVLAARVEGGESIRFVPRAPCSIVVVDDTAAVLDLSRYDESGTGSLLVRSPPLVQALGAVVDEAWRLGWPLQRVLDQTPLDDRDMRIIALLAAGASDVTIARQAGISQRTVERRLRVLMDRLGAKTRFQAGIAASRRGWV